MLLQAAGTIRSFTNGHDLAAYLGNKLVQSAVERQFAIIGEALSVLWRREPGVAARLPKLAEAVGLRNLLIHAYGRIDSVKIWRVVTDDLAQLEADLRGLLDEVAPGWSALASPTSPPPP